MPREDQTGPDGCGPLTGRGLGPCSDKQRSGSGKRELRRGNRQQMMYLPKSGSKNSRSLANRPANLFDEIIALLEEIRDLKNNLSTISSLVKKMKLAKKKK